MKAKVTLQINLAPGDYPHARHILKHQLDILSAQVDEVILTIDTKAAKGRFAEGWRLYQEQFNDFIETEIVGSYNVKIVPVDYSLNTKKQVAEYFFGSDYIPDNDFRGGPFYVYFFGLYSAANDIIFHLDSDIFFGGGSQQWIGEALDKIVGDEKCLIVSPLPGPPHKDDLLTGQSIKNKIAPYTYQLNGMSTRLFMIDRSKFAQHKLTLPKPGFRNQIKAFIEGNPNAALPEEIIGLYMQKNDFDRIDLLGSRAGLWSLHPPYRTKGFYEQLPALIKRIERNDLPESQHGFYDIVDEVVDWTEARENLRVTAGGSDCLAIEIYDLKRVLIISPYFPPVNAADMQRVRMSLAYYRESGWEAEVVTVDPHYTDMDQDELLCDSIPGDIVIHSVKALDKKWTSKVGLGSLALRSLWYYKQKVDELLKSSHFDLIYFSTTQFPVCVLGAHWKNKFSVPYVIDFQDPWHSKYYQDKPKEQRPPKYWFSYRLNKMLEPIALKQVSGIVSVSQAYIGQLKARYPSLAAVPSVVIPFGYLEKDMLIANDKRSLFPSLLNPAFKNVVYVGRGGADLHAAISPLFEALKTDTDRFKNIRFHFIGTSYAPKGTGTATILPLAQKYQVQNQVIEITDRISFYHALTTLQQANALFIPGSEDSGYTASKIYPYLMANKPLLAIFHPSSPVFAMLKAVAAAHVYSYSSVDQNTLKQFLSQVATGNVKPPRYDVTALEKNSARELTMRQCLLFEQATNYSSTNR